MTRIGIIGYGHRIHAMDKLFFREIDPSMRVVGLVDPDREGASARLKECQDQEAEFFSSVDELVKNTKPHGLVIGTRCPLHTPYAIDAAKYKIPLFLEKPVSISMQQAIALDRAFRKSKCEVVVSFPLRVSSLVQKSRGFIEAGQIGEPVHIKGMNYVPYGRGYFEHGNSFRFMQGLFLQKATHDLDYMMYLMGSPIVRVAAMAMKGKVFGSRKKPKGLTCSKCEERDTCPEAPEARKRLGDPHSNLQDHLCPFGKDVGSPGTGMNEDCSSALLEFASGAQGVYTQVFFTRKKEAASRGSMVCGYKGTIRFDFHNPRVELIRHHDPFDLIETTGEKRGSHFGGDIRLTRNFFDLIHGRGKSESTIQDGLRSVYACLAAKESSETGKFVRARQLSAK